MRNTITYKDYTGSVEFSQEDALFFGKVLGIQALISYEGTDAQSLLEDFQSAVDQYLSMCDAKGIEPEKAFKGTFNVRISPDLHKKAAIAATTQQITLNSFVAQSIERAVATYPQFSEKE